MNLIFLDFDGVLNDHTVSNSNYCTISPVAVDQLNRILASVPDAMVVISSAWRYLVHGGEMTAKGFQSLMCTHGICCYGRIVGVTETDEATVTRNHGRSRDDDDYFDFLKDAGHQLRAEQITYYLQCRRSVRPVDAYVVLDDLDIPIDNLVRTDGNIGLTAADADRAIAILKGDN